MTSVADRLSRLCLLLCLVAGTACQGEKSAEAGAGLDGISKDAFDTLYGDPLTPSNQYKLVALDTGWRFDNLQTMNSVTQPLAAGKGETGACAASDTPRFTLPAQTPVTLLFTSEQTAKTLTPGFRRTCIPEWGVEMDYVPGSVSAFEVETGDARALCAVCEDGGGGGTASSALLIEIAPSPVQDAPSD